VSRWRRATIIVAPSRIQTPCLEWHLLSICHPWPVVSLSTRRGASPSITLGHPHLGLRHYIWTWTTRCPASRHTLTTDSLDIVCMATMFRSFSFAPASPPSYSAYEAERAAMNLSPTSRPSQQDYFGPALQHNYASRTYTPSCTIGDLASKLNQQSLRIDPARPSTPPSEADTVEPQPLRSRTSASLLRMQRQANARMQCCSSHVRDISRLARMIADEEQCTLSATPSRTASTSTASDSDEGIDMDYDALAQGVEPQRRAGERRESCIRVTKPVRMRRRSNDKAEKQRPL
jgi:hypothetical protein